MITGLNYVLLLLQFVFSVNFHPLHLSVTNIEYREEKEAFEIAFKVFYDDFERIIQAKYGVDLKLGQKDERPDYETYARKYIDEHFKLQLGKEVKETDSFVFLKKEMNHEAVWFYYEVKTKQKIKEIKIEHSLMYDLFKDQKNLIIFTYKDLQEGYQLKYDDKEIRIEL